ncbi:MAG: ribosome maturation factor RimM [Clostridiales bacterium]|nr:ribosome maturation factor RimM [Eubacterium sp.]MDD7350161.1 ribosome maturation factor RimM [Clostridiales bacterium]
MEQLLRVGVITTTHGIRGEVKVFPTTDDIHRFDDLDEVILQNKREQLTLHVEHVKYFKNIVIVKFKEYNNINDVEMFRKCDLFVTRENAVPLEEGEYFICDIIGAQVKNEEDGNVIGKVKDVLETGANLVFLIESNEGKELLFPSIPECIKKVDVEKMEVIAHVMPGLMELGQ